MGESMFGQEIRGSPSSCPWGRRSRAWRTLSLGEGQVTMCDVAHGHLTEAFLLWVYREEIALSGIDPEFPQILESVSRTIDPLPRTIDPTTEKPYSL